MVTVAPSHSPQSHRMCTGGDFIYRSVLSEPILTPEQFTYEHHQFRKTAEDFMRNELAPSIEEIEHKKPGLMVSLMRRAAELGLLMVEIPEAYGGLGLGKAISMLISESLAQVGSFAVTYGAHAGIGTMPIVYYGTEDQKQRFLPALAQGKILAAYALSEPGSGSDALGAKASARLSEDGQSYILSGTKQWITNAAWADLFTIFAQVDGNKLTAFLVERTRPGLSIGPEERKLGIRGSSTCQVILDDVSVPVSNVLGKVGRGHKIAFNILNIGRFKLGVSSLGASKYALKLGIAYAKERRQFKKPIASFGLIRQKIATAAMLIYTGESMAYRLAGMLDDRLALLDTRHPEACQQAVDTIEDFTIEASILKVFGSEALYHIADEMLQIHGGNGYTEDYPLERVWRDARINRIFEGTNEINRLIIPATLLKRALMGQSPLMSYTNQVMEELNTPASLPQQQPGILGAEIWAIERTKRAVVYAASHAVQKYMEDLKEKQRILGALADCLIDVYGMDSAVARAHAASTQLPASQARIHGALSKLCCFDAHAAVFQRLRRIATMMAEDGELETLYTNLTQLDPCYPIAYMDVQEEVASCMLQGDGYTLHA